MEGKHKMKASWEKIDSNRVMLTVEVDEDRVADSLHKSFTKVSKKVNVPGFRKGRVPRVVFEARFGVESLYHDAIDILLPEVYEEAVKHTEISPVDRPDVDVEQFMKGKPFKFTAKVTVKPEVKLAEYKGIEVAMPSFSVTEEQVNAELERLQQRHAELVVVEEAAALKGDITVIDFEGFVDEKPFEGGKGDQYSLELGSNAFIPGFEEQLIGMHTGDTKNVEVTFPESYHATELAGKEAVFKVKVKEIKRKKLPQLDDEFAKDVSEFDTFEQYVSSVKQQLTEEEKKKANERYRRDVVNKVTEGAEIDIPPAMIDSEVQRMMRELDGRLNSQGMNLDTFLSISGKSSTDMQEEMKDEAVQRVRNSLVLEQVAKEQNIEVTEKDMTNKMEQMSKAYNRPVDEMQSIFEKNGMINNLRDEVKFQKTVDFLVNHSKELE